MAGSPPQAATSPRFWIRFCCWLAKQRGLFWGTITFGVVLNLFATWLVTPWGSTFSNTPLGTVLGYPWISLSIGVSLLALTGVVTFVSHKVDASISHMQSIQGLTQQNRSILIRILHQEYRKRLEHSLQGAVMIAVGLYERTDLVRSSLQLVFHRLSTSVEHPLSPDTSIVQAYDEAGQRLLILGEPGAGKTTLLLELSMGLLIRAEDDLEAPIPVILNLSSWASKKAPLESWLIDQLKLVYGIPSRLSQKWLEQDRWLLLLDGLDEVEETSRSACIEVINTYREMYFAPLVVCSRSREYLAQESRLALSNAVVVQPLQEKQVTEYLKRLGRSMIAVRAVLRGNPILRQLITTPLMLHVIVLTYRDKTVKDLPQGSPEEQQRQIFDQYTHRMLEKGTIKEQFTAQQTRYWLIWLAQQMKQRHLTEFYLEWLQPSWLTTKGTQFAYELLYVLTLILFFIPIVGLAFERLLSGLIGGLIFGLSVGLTENRLKPIEPIEVLMWSWKRFWQGVLGGLTGGLLGGLFGALFRGLLGMPLGHLFFCLIAVLIGAFVMILFSEPTGKVVFAIVGFFVMMEARDFVGGLVGCLFKGLFAGTIFGVVSGIIGGVIGGTSSVQINKDRRIRPNQGIQNSIENSFRFVMSIGLPFTLVFSLLGRTVGDIVGGLNLGLALGLLGGLIVGGRVYFNHYILRYILFRSGAMPWHYARFLDEATERILLQRVGGGYRFIHPLFQEYFATLDTRASPKPPSPQQI